MRDLVNVDTAALEQRTVTAFPYIPGSTWRGYRRDSPVPGTARCTYNPIDPWTMKARERPYDVFVNGTAGLSYATLGQALSHLRARGFNMPNEPLPLYPDDTEVSATAI